MTCIERGIVIMNVTERSKASIVQVYEDYVEIRYFHDALKGIIALDNLEKYWVRAPLLTPELCFSRANEYVGHYSCSWDLLERPPNDWWGKLERLLERNSFP